MPPYRRGGADSRGASARSGGLGIKRSSEFVILRSPENITDVDSDTEDDWDREYRPKVNKTGKPTKKVTRSMGQADDVESLVDLEDYSPRGPSRKRGGAKVGSNSNTSTVGGQISFVESAVSSGDSYGPSEEDSEDDDTPPPFKTSKIAGRSRANKEVGKARARAGTIVCASSTGRRSATQEIKSTQQKKRRPTASYEAKTAERVAEIAAKKAPHLVALARINAEAERLREQLRLKKQEREIMERVWGVVRSTEKGKIGLGRKTEKPKTTSWVTESGNEGPFEISSSSEVTRRMSLLREELQEESEGWNSLFDESEKMSGVDSNKADKPIIPQPRKKVPGKLRETSEAREKSQNEGEKRKLWFEENTDGEFAERTGSGPAARFPAPDSDSLFGDSEGVQVQGGRRQFSETKKALYRPKISQQEKKRLSDSRSIDGREQKRQHHWKKKRKYLLEANTHGELTGRRCPRKTLGFPVSGSDSLSGGSGTHSGRGSRKKFKKATGVLQGGPGKGFGIHSKRRRPYEGYLGPHDEKVASKKKVECGKGGDVTKADSHLSNWPRWRERVGKSKQELATSNLDIADGARPGEIGVKHLGLQEVVGGDRLVRGAQEDLRAGSDLECLGGKQSGPGTGDELERVNEEIDALLGECDVNSTSLQDDRKSLEGYDADPFHSVPEMLWEGLVGVGGVGDSSTMGEHTVAGSMDKGLGDLDRELELVQKELEKDLDFMDWDGAEFLKFDDDADLHLTVEDPKGDAGNDGVGEQEHGIENRALALHPQRSPQKPLSPGDILEESARGNVLADLEQEKMGHRLGGPEDEGNDTLEEDEKNKIYNPVRVRNRASNSCGRVRVRQYSMKEIADYSMASLFQTYKDEIEKMEMKDIKPVKSSVARRSDGGMGRGGNSQRQGVGNIPGGEPKADGFPNLVCDKVYESGAEDPRMDTLSEWGGCGGSGKREQEEGVRDVTPNPLQYGKIGEKREAEGKITDSTPSSLELTDQKKESSGFVGVDASSPEDGEVVELEQKGSDSIPLNICLAETPDNCMRYLGARFDKGSIVGKVLDHDSAVFPGETAKLYRVELPDSSMGYVLAEMVSGAWSMVFMTDAQGDGCGKTQRNPPQLDSDGGFLSGAGERASQSPKLAPQSISEEGVRSEVPETWARGCQEECDGKGIRPVGRQSQSSPLKRTFEDPNWDGVGEGKQQKQEPSTQDRHEDNNDWD